MTEQQGEHDGLSRRRLLGSGAYQLGKLFLPALGITALGVFVSGCGDSSGGGGGGSTPSPSTKTVAAALTDAAGPSNVSRKSTSHGQMIIKAGSANGDDLVYTVNGKQYNSQSADQTLVKTGDVVDFEDLVNGSRYSFVVS